MEQRILLGTIVTLLFLIALAIAGPVTADPLPPPPGMGERPNGPPPEAFTACEGKKAGDAVIVTTPRGDEIKAVCEIMDSRLVAKPLNAPQPKKLKE